MHKKISSEIAIGIIVAISFVIGILFWRSVQQIEYDKQGIVSSTQQPVSNNRDAMTSGVASKSQIANPASEFCASNGGKSEIRTSQDGGQTGYCVFENGGECEEWAYMKGECRNPSHP